MTAPPLKLPRLPDRNPIKLTVLIEPDLHHELARYAEAYQQAYGQAEPVATLVPHMLRAFLESDRAFVRAQRQS